MSSNGDDTHDGRGGDATAHAGGGEGAARDGAQIRCPGLLECAVRKLDVVKIQLEANTVRLNVERHRLASTHEQFATLSHCAPGYGGVRSRFFCVFKTGHLGVAATAADVRCIAATGVVAVGGDATFNATLYQQGPLPPTRTDVVTYVALYGLEPDRVPAIRVASSSSALL
jgi:hypothetical protein